MHEAVQNARSLMNTTVEERREDRVTAVEFKGKFSVSNFRISPRNCRLHCWQNSWGTVHCGRDQKSSTERFSPELIPRFIPRDSLVFLDSYRRQ